MCLKRFITICFLCLLTVPDGAFSSPIPLDDMDKKKLRSLKQSELDFFTDKYQQAASLYYDNAYALALPLFRELAARVDTLDVLYLYGMAAQRANQPALAILKFNAILERNPTLHQVRMDLAMTLFQQGKKEEAIAQLEKVISISEENTVKIHAQKLVNLILGSEQRLFASVNGSLGLQYDSNINAISDDLPNNLSADREEGFGIPLSLSGNLIYDFGETGGFAWRNQGSYYRLDHLGSDQFDFEQIDLHTSLTHRGNKLRSAAGVGYVFRWYGQNPLSETWYLSGDASYPLQKNIDLKARLKYEDETYDVYSSQNQNTLSFSVTPSYLHEINGQDRLMLASIKFGISGREADTDRYSYDNLKIAPSLVYRHTPKTQLYSQISYDHREYDGNASLAGAPTSRSDDRLRLSAILSHDFDMFKTSLNYAYTNNDSNTVIYDYEKSVIGINFSMDWSL
ncbi:MAG: DUF560 domain-containing protein [Magnetococcales bacterium]|nr:DUF560 domain-containing protein [Magnetococcales bacterium]